MNNKTDKVFIVDAGAIFFRKIHGQCITVPEVINEVKDDNSKLYFSVVDVKVKEPSKENVELVKKMAKSTGDIHKLSDTDIKLIALAIEELKNGKDVTILTDDYSIQNLSKNIGIKVESVVKRGIVETFRWIKICKGCGRPLNNKTNICPVCGSEAVIRRVRVEKNRRSN